MAASRRLYDPAHDSTPTNVNEYDVIYTSGHTTPPGEREFCPSRDCSPTLRWRYMPCCVMMQCVMLFGVLALVSVSFVYIVTISDELTKVVERLPRFNSSSSYSP